MKLRKTLFIFSLLIPSIFNNTSILVNAADYSSLTKNINLNAVSEENIRSYYNDLNSLENNQRQGENLLKNLKPILRNNFTYISYENVWKAYEITDRNWSLSPANSTSFGNYNEKTNYINDYEYGSSKDKKNNPYIHCYYRDQSLEDSKIKAWDDHTAKGINREHSWPQSHGFKFDGNGAQGPAGTDLHHLVAADGFVNQSLHNNYAYGFVKDVETIGNRESTKNNKFGTAKNTSSSDLANKVFEPIDQDKGDIARACFYMVAMYNNLANETNAISTFDPNLELVFYITPGENSTYSSDTTTAVYGNIKDLLEWNKLDPVDEYEMHRNDLIFNNYQNNRNPFIDFPQWADIVWGDDKNTKYANPLTDELCKSNEYIAPIESEGFDFSSIPFYVYIIVGVIVVIVLILLIVVFSKMSKKNQKKVKKAIKKSVKSSSKGKKKSSSKSKTKK